MASLRINVSVPTIVPLAESNLAVTVPVCAPLYVESKVVSKYTGVNAAV